MLAARTDIGPPPERRRRAQLILHDYVDCDVRPGTWSPEPSPPVVRLDQAAPVIFVRIEPVGGIRTLLWVVGFGGFRFSFSVSFVRLTIALHLREA